MGTLDLDALEDDVFVEAAINTLLGRPSRGEDFTYVKHELQHGGRQRAVSAILASEEFASRFLSSTSIERALSERAVRLNEIQVQQDGPPRTVELGPMSVRVRGQDLLLYDFPPCTGLRWVLEEMRRDDYGLDYFELPSSPVIFDVGAHVGVFSILAARRWPDARIFAFEPVRATFDLLEANLELNDVRNVTAVNAAISGVGGVVELAFAPSINSGGSTSVWDEPPAHWSRITARALPFEDAMAEVGVEHINFLKVDCEGAEHHFLDERFPWSKVERIAAELHDSEDLQAQGYSVGRTRTAIVNAIGSQNFRLTVANKDNDKQR